MACACSASNVSAKFLQKAFSKVVHSQGSSCRTPWLATWSVAHRCCDWTHSMTCGPCKYVRNSMHCWKGFCIAGVAKLTPTKRLHCVRNSSALVRSRLNTCGSLPMNRSEDRGCICPPVLAPGDPPPLGGPPPPGGPPPGRVWIGPLGHLPGSPPPGGCPLPKARVCQDISKLCMPEKTLVEAVEAIVVGEHL
jgi:hypothetical protein